MRKLIAVAVAAAALSLSLTSPGAALPPIGFGIAPQASDESPIDKARLVCVNRWSGRIIHYGPCGGYRPVYVRRYVCRSVYTGRIIHYGRC